ncbi:hypothetical protein A8709_15160 [Paenibacillus pectinilyticus]|uniref:Uncharacterized protein n=1 Tax=Paenibacillus pectinilyticus TaxID=512399 RepID=A0A1C1A4C6_9BACL|nr:DUF4082 domain-containing protein [Paenibacillus pectinilyticus]OCT15417.1 hypothetical protein A8709_15160 [Paenibacillus pectinilyticus]
MRWFRQITSARSAKHTRSTKWHTSTTSAKLLSFLLILVMFMSFLPVQQAFATDTQINDNNGSITYSGAWTYDTTGASGYINNDQHYAITNGNYAQYTFTGTSIKWIGPKNVDCGISQVYIDGTLVATVDMYASSWLKQQVLYSNTSLTNASHTIKVVVTNTKNASSAGYYSSIDAFAYDTVVTTGEKIFADSLAGTARSNATQHELGQVFNVTVSGQITKVRLYAVSQESGNHTARIWRNSDGAKLTEFTVPSSVFTGVNSWVSYSLPTPLAISPSTDYTVSVSTGTDTGYYWGGGTNASAGSNGQHVNWPANSARFTDTMGAMPATTPSGGESYLRDIEFVPDTITSEKIFTDTTTAPSVNNGFPVELGEVFQSSVPGQITAIRVYATAAESGSHTARIWRNHDNTVVGGPYTITYGGTAGWITYSLPTPISITELIDYTVSVSTGTDTNKAIPLTSLPNAGNNGSHLSYPMKAGRFTANVGQRPNVVPSAADNYLRDVVFVAGTLPAPDASLTKQSLDGSWRIAQDTGNTGISSQWFNVANYPFNSAMNIQVPGTIYEAFPSYNGITWYGRFFNANLTVASDMKYYIKFGAVQYKSQVWVNGQNLGTHEGSDTPFEVDVTSALVQGGNFISVRVENPKGVLSSGAVPVFWDNGGIVQHVDLVKQPKLRVLDVYAKPDISTGNIDLQITLENNTGASQGVTLSTAYGVFNGSNIGTVNASVTAPTGQSVSTMTVTVPSVHLWSPSDPYLYSLSISAVSGGKTDVYAIPRFGFKDFRIVNGYFMLNNQRIFLKGVHQNFYDPVNVQGTARDMSLLGQDFDKLKQAGFNMYRSIAAAALPEQLDLADEKGILIYEEHQGSWNLSDASKFNLSVSDVIKRDRNRVSVAMFGLLNENKNNAVYTAAKNFLPTLRTIDTTKLVMLGSARWDNDLTTGSASNPGSSTWNVYLGGESPTSPVSTGSISDLLPMNPAGAFTPGAGDVHVYNTFPNTWNFINSFASLGSTTNNIFVSEAGVGGMFNAIDEDRKLHQYNAGPLVVPWSWTTNKIAALNAIWTKYGMSSVYPNIEDAAIDSQKSESKQRAQLFSTIRSNPKIMGYSLTSLTDSGGSQEGIMTNFRDWKADILPVLQDGWAELKWNLFVNPMTIYTNSTFHVRVNLSNEDVLTAGTYPSTLTIKNAGGTAVWTQNVNIVIPSGTNPPFSYAVYDADITVPGLVEGDYTLNATLNTVTNAKSNTLGFKVFSTANHPGSLGQVTVLGVTQAVRDLLTSKGATLHEYNASESLNNEVIVVGNSVTNNAATWRPLYKKAASGAQIVFLSSNVFSGNTGPNKWIKVANKGDQSGVYNGLGWLYHAEQLAKPTGILNTLPAKLMSPDVYGDMLGTVKYLRNITAPTVTTAFSIDDNGSNSYADGLLIGTYNEYAGKFTVNTFDLMSNIGKPVADRMILNMVAYAKSTTSAVQALPANYDTELNTYGIVD